MSHDSPAVRMIETARAATGYDARLDGLGDGHWAAMREVRALDRRSAPGARALLHAVVEGPVPGGCSPMCCQASYVRATVLQARRDVLRAWTRIDPEAAEDFSAETVEGLMGSKAIAIAAAQMLCRAPRAAVKHAERLVHHARKHDRWQVRLAVARTVRVAVKAGAKPRGVSGLAKRLLADPNREMQREGERLHRALTPPPPPA